MSFQGKSFWMPTDSGCLTNGEVSYDNSSRIEPKRSHTWFMDGAEELTPNKKQAVEAPSNISFTGLLNSNISPWGNAPVFQSLTCQFTERLFDPEPMKTTNFDERSIHSISEENSNMGMKGIDASFGNDSAFSLSMSHGLEYPSSGFNYGGIRKVKVSQVRDPENAMSASMGPDACARGDEISAATTQGFSKGDNSIISMGLSYNRGDDSVLSVGDSDSYNSTGQPYNKGDGSTILTGHHCRGDGNAMIAGPHSVGTGDDVISIGQSLSNQSNSVISMIQPYTKSDDTILSMKQSYSMEDSSSVTIGNLYHGSHSTASVGQSTKKVDSSCLPNLHSFDKGEGGIISFGGFNNDEDASGSGRYISSYELLMSQPSIQRSNALSQGAFVVSDVNAFANAAQAIASGAEGACKKKDDQKSSKKTPPNNFPSNVRSLLSTGILDGVPVKYIAWSREKELRGIIRGSGYLCGCQSCSFSKVINAYEFERHATCKTKHPNNHIYFENGKTIYGIVQELRSTPQNMLFDVIQTITGSPINQKSFRLWKESFLAATRELHRIYGNDEGKQLS